MTFGEWITANKWWLTFIVILLLLALGLWNPPTEILQTLGEIAKGLKE